MSGKRARQARQAETGERLVETYKRIATGGAGACPDCNAATRLVDSGGGVFVLQVMHDDTCPELARHERRSGS